MEDDGSLQNLLVIATNPLGNELDSEAVQKVCDRIQADGKDGPNTALRFLAHKIQSPLEREALQALMVLEECAQRCGSKFQDEVGKFRFLNELIKVVSPKYLGNRSSQAVKQRVIELLYRWSVESMRQQTKVGEAYHMLKRQGVITMDPTYVLEDLESAHGSGKGQSSDRNSGSIFEDSEKSIQLQRLLRSKDPEDLQAANRLIKSMVKEADRRMELLARRASEIETVHTSARVLRDMLAHYQPNTATQDERDILKELYENCERLRPRLFRLAGDMEENDEGLTEILTANDELTHVITVYKETMGMEKVTNNGSNDVASGGNMLLEFGTSKQSSDMGDNSGATSSSSHAAALLDDQLLSLGLNDISLSAKPPAVAQSAPAFYAVDNNCAAPLLPQSVAPLSAVTATSTVLAPKSTVGRSGFLAGTGLDELDVLGKSLMQQALPTSQGASQGDFQSSPSKIPLNQLKQQQMQQQKSSSPISTPPYLSSQNMTFTMPSPLMANQNSPRMMASQQMTNQVAPSFMTSSFAANQRLGASVTSPNLNTPFTTSLLDMPNTTETPSIFSSIENGSIGSTVTSSASLPPCIDNITVPLEKIMPGTLSPLTIVDEDGVNVTLAFAAPQPPVRVTVLTVTNKCAKVLSDFQFHIAVPKSMSVKLQPLSGTTLPSFNPILPLAALTQVILMAPHTHEGCSVKYKISFTLGGDERKNEGEIPLPPEEPQAAAS